MTLIELIIYIALLFLIMTGSVFSAYSILLSQQSNADTWNVMSRELF